VEAAASVEAMLMSLLATFPAQLDSTPECEDRTRVEVHFASIAKEIGLLDPGRAELPKELASVDPGKLRIAASGRYGSLNSLFLLCLSAARSHASHPFRTQRLDWVGMAAGISLLRGHGNRAPTYESLTKAVDDVISMAQVLCVDSKEPQP
jgi:hypothetical protein